MSYTNELIEKKIRELTNYKTDGFFVDIGAYDGLSISNTKNLEDLGWQGICIEPHPKVYERLCQNRKCEKVNCAVWFEDTYINFLSLTGYTEMLSGIMETYDERHYSRIQSELSHHGGQSEIIKVQAKKFDNIVPKKIIDFLSIDTEGSELEILNNIDFDVYDIKVICVENNFFEKKFDDFFNEKNYRLEENIFIDYFYVKN